MEYIDQDNKGGIEEVKIKITNSGDIPVNLTSLSVEWSVEVPRAKLQYVGISGATLFSDLSNGELPPYFSLCGEGCTDLMSGTPGTLAIPGDTTKIMVFSFSRNLPNLDDFMVNLEFNGQNTCGLR